MEEVLDVYTREGNYVGTRPRSYFSQGIPTYYHKPVWIWIVNSQGKILVQKRSSTKKVSPNAWDMSCAGHVVAGETSLQGAIRELQEELGITMQPEQLKQVGEYIVDEVHVIAQIYLLVIESDVIPITLQKEEVADVCWLTIQELKTLLYSTEFVSLDDTYREIVLQLLQNAIDKLS